jgi:hypothetical protein
MINLMKLKNLNKKAPLRINLKITLDFWAFKPYKEKLTYGIDGLTYSPTSYRFLCFAITTVKESDKVVFEIASSKVSGNEGKKFNKS